MRSARRSVVVGGATALFAALALAGCGGAGWPTRPDAPPATHPRPPLFPPSGPTRAGTVLSFVSGETREPAARATVTVAGRAYATDDRGELTLVSDASLDAPLEVDAPGFLPRETSMRATGTSRFTLWPARSSTGLDEAYTSRLVYTSAGEPDAPAGAQAMQRLGVRRVSVLPSDGIRRDRLAVAAHEAAVDALNGALGGAVVYVLVSARTGGLTIETKMDPGNPHCARRVRAVTVSSLRGDEITGGTVVFCDLEASRSLTVTHELGHTFGLQHSPDPTEVMYTYHVPGRAPAFSPREGLTMALMLQRRAGNRYPDSDRHVTGSAAHRTHVTVCP